MNKPFLILVFSLLCFGVISCKKEGCTDLKAENYNEKADINNGSCIYGTDSITAEITEDITTPTILEAQNYEICTDINISSDLTLLAGTKLIMCEGSSITVESTGFLNASGTKEKPIEIKGKNNVKGYWAGIAFKSNHTNNKLIHTTIRDGGSYSGWKYSTVYVDENALLSAENSTFENSNNYGLYIDNDGAINSFSNNSFGNNTIGLSLQPNDVSKLDSNSNYNNSNTNNYIEVRSGNLNIQQQWQTFKTPLLLSNITITAGLEILAGSNILIESNQSISISESGYLRSIGTADQPITIAGKEQVAGYWGGIEIGSFDSNNLIRHTTISDAGQNQDYQFSNIYVDGRLDIENSIIKNANSYGMYITSVSSIYANGTLQTNVSSIESNNEFLANGNGPNANCINNCTVFFE